jgi:hypothetical protein
MIRGHQGLYALYKKDKLYYVGLARNLKNRIRHHLKDRHQGKWTHFSLYVIKKAGHIKELESLLLRIAYPAGNTQKGKLRSAKNLLPILKRQVKQKIRQEIIDIFEDIYGHKGKKKKIKIKHKGDRPLQGYFPEGKVIYANYKGKEYKAWVSKNGRIQFNNNFYDSLSTAGTAIIDKGAVDGWYFWKYKDKNGNFKPIAELRE